MVAPNEDNNLTSQSPLCMTYDIIPEHPPAPFFLYPRIPLRCPLITRVRSFHTFEFVTFVGFKFRQLIQAVL